MSVVPGVAGRGQPPPEVVARLRAAGCVFAEEEAALLVSAARTSAELADLVDRRVSGLPVEHVVGWAEFCGLRIAVDPGVFVPRRRTELLAEQAIEQVRSCSSGAAAVVVDLCCGSGAIGAAVLAAVPTVELHASDIDPRCVRCARRNLPGIAHRIHQGHLYGALPASLSGRVDVLVANVPYVPTDEIELLPAEARLHEPRTALDGGADGLDVLRRVADDAARWLAPSGRLLMEVSSRQASAAAQAFAAGGLGVRVSTSREATVVIGSAAG
jgi:release factor glutamine methyltransferase